MRTVPRPAFHLKVAVVLVVTAGGVTVSFAPGRADAASGFLGLAEFQACGVIVGRTPQDDMTEDERHTSKSSVIPPD